MWWAGQISFAQRFRNVKFRLLFGFLWISWVFIAFKVVSRMFRWFCDPRRPSASQAASDEAFFGSVFNFCCSISVYQFSISVFNFW